MRRYSRKRHMSLQKVLPSVPRSLRSRRQLHTAFWNHGAASIELFDACQGLLGGEMEAPLSNATSSPATDKRADLMTASAFLLDFLYPRGTLSLLRKLNCNPLDRYERPTFLLNSPLSRFQAVNVGNTACLGASSHAKGEAGVAVPAKRADQDVPVSAHRARDSAPEDGLESFEDHFLSFEDRFRPETAKVEKVEITDPERLEKALSMGSSAFPDHVWHLYEHLHPDVKDRYNVHVARFLAAGGWIPEPRKYGDLVNRLDPSQWSQEIVIAGIKTALVLDDVASATSLFSRALDLNAWTGGFDLLLAHCLRTSRFDELLDMWAAYRDRLTSGGSPKMSLNAVIETSNLSAKLHELWEHLRSSSHAKTWTAMKETYNSILLAISANAFEKLKKQDATFILKHLRDPIQYEEFIKGSVRRGDYKLAADLYSAYRKLPDVKIRVPVLREMLSVFYPHNDHGMEMVLKDWYSRYDKLDYVAYRKFISFYASRGNVEPVLRLWNEYKELYRSKAWADGRTVRALLEVYAVRGDVRNARQVFDKITRGRNTMPDTIQYNILLSAHAKAWDIHGALETFSELCQIAEPNNYSFGYLMGMTGSRGNLQLTLGLYKLARDMGIPPDVAMVQAIIEAYCQNDRIEAAESVCNITTKRRALREDITFAGIETSSYTVLWNTVLKHYALRHDLTNVNRILEEMTQLNVSYDSKTYEYLLLALIRVNQSMHALQLVQIAEQKGIFVPSAEHYLLLMSGFLTTREPSVVMKISRLMREKHYPDSAEKMTKLMVAFGQWAQLRSGRRLGTPTHYFLEAALTAFRKSLGREDRTVRDDLRSVSEQYARMVDVLVQMREFASIPEIVALYESQFPDSGMPMKLLYSLMRADFYEKKYDRVMVTWNKVFEETIGLSGGSPPAPVRDDSGEMAMTAPGHRYLVNEALATVFKVMEAVGNGEALFDLVTKVRNAGFTLGQQNWNRYVQLLARFGRWKDAFFICEEVLMPRWSGWQRRRQQQFEKKRLPLDLRRMGKSDRYARPNTHTLLVLIKQYMELEQLAPWSSEQAALLETINQQCPRLVRAAKTMMPTGSDLEQDVFGKDIALGGDSDILRYIMKDEDFSHSSEEAELAYPRR